MSMETLLATTVRYSPGFDPALALGRIHSILSALIQHCQTRVGYRYTGCFTCELQIRPQGNAYVPPVVPDYEAKAELLRMWELVRTMDVPDGALISESSSSSPTVSEPHHLLLTKTTKPFISDALQPRESITHFLSWTMITPFALYFALKICYSVFWKILPIATLIFQIVFFFHFLFFAMIFCAIFCAAILLSC